MTKLAVAGSIALLCCALYAGVSSAKIVAGKSVAGVSVGDSSASVRKRLGKPTEQSPGSPAFYSYKSRGLVVAFVGGKVIHIFTDSKHQRTSDGVGPGVTRAAVQKRYPSCGKGFANYCFLPSGKTKQPQPGKRYTFVSFTGKRVDSMIVGRWDPKNDECALGCG
jgi:hypothetical protein